MIFSGHGQICLINYVDVGSYKMETITIITTTTHESMQLYDE